MRWSRYAVIAFLCGATAFSLYEYVSLLSEKSGLQAHIEEAEQELAKLATITQERNQFAQDNTLLREQINEKQASLAQFREKLGLSEKALEDMTERLAIARSESLLLAAEADSARLQARTAAEERDQLQARLSSIKELKNAIRELKYKARLDRRQVRLQLLKERPVENGRAESVLLVGNGGFLIKNGKPTYPSRINIQVIPTPDKG